MLLVLLMLLVAVMFTISQVIGWEVWVFCTVQEIGLEDCSIKCCAGIPASWIVLDIFFWKIPGPEKSWKITLVLESPVNYSLGYWKVTANIHILHHAEFSAVDYTLTVVSKCRFSLNLNIHGLHGLRTGPGKFFTGSWKSPEFFVSKRVGTLDVQNAEPCLLLKYLSVFQQYLWTTCDWILPRFRKKYKNWNNS